MLFTIVLLATLALSVLGTPIGRRGAMVEEVRAEQTAVVHMEERADEQPGLPKNWSAEKRADDEPGAPSIWSVEKRADDEPGAPGIWSVEKRAPVAAKSKQLKRANYPTPQP
ncbi:hypothetical protein HO173_001841 [Letharia columbiana]|uniref:Secreted protein n=1 Tax=Letharia columbiana TaxID=112416 RepID=A0A8H6G4I4_9LECA|nr:uncharacterized protein HO173_001841 [Letharia columbiana]KAF6240230.1 hypothetical protein HO173_001841 [Letharia columbiana]